MTKNETQLNLSEKPMSMKTHHFIVTVDYSISFYVTLTTGEPE